MPMETAVWMDWRRVKLPEAARVYFGNETCERNLPLAAVAGEVARRLRGCGVAVTLVTPFLTEAGLAAASAAVREVVAVDPVAEIVCSDWGLLRWVAREHMGVPVAGRLLAGQIPDPRIARVLDAGRARPVRELEHVDGMRCELRYRAPSAELARHLRASWWERPSMVAFAVRLGVRRAEINQLPQGLAMAAEPGWHYSLHLPEVLVALMRQCAGGCPAGGCGKVEEEWEARCGGMKLVRRGNGLYYRGVGGVGELEGMGVDRVVWRE